MVIFDVWAQEYPSVNPHDRQTVNDKTQCNKSGQNDLILVDVAENQVFSNKGGRDGETR